MKHKYTFFCGGAVEERLMPREMRWNGELLVFEDVPMGVCIQCGENTCSLMSQKELMLLCIKLPNTQAVS